MPAFSIQFLSVMYLPVIVISIALAVVVYHKNRSSATNRIFGLLGLVTGVWLLSLLVEEFAQYYHWKEFLLWMARISMVISAPHASLFFLLAHTLPYDNFRLSKNKLSLLLISMAAVMILNFTPYAFLGAKLVNGRFEMINGPLLLISEFFLAVVSISAFYILIKKMRRAEGVEKRQLVFMFLGMLLMVGLLLLTIVVPVLFLQDSRLLNLSPLYSMIFVVCTAIAIVKYQLFNVRIIATEFLVLIFNSILFVQLVASSSFKRGVFNGFLLILSAALSYLLVKFARRELKKEQAKTRAEALEESNRRLEQLDKQKTEFLNIAAHQLRTPVSIIKNYVAMLQEGDYGEVSEEVKQVHKNIEESNEWLVRLADEFLNIANLEQGRTRFRFEKVNIADLADSVVKELAVKAEKKGLKITRPNNADNLIIQADPEKLRNAIFNLVDNAVKYSERGEIVVETAAKDSGAAVRVVDQGIGFDKNDEKVLFQKFQRGELAKKHEANTSSGLGLYIIRMFVEGHGGRVWGRSAGEGKGSEFGFWIPEKQG